jgi:hypothetical protein
LIPKEQLNYEYSQDTTLSQKMKMFEAQLNTSRKIVQIAKDRCLQCNQYIQRQKVLKEALSTLLNNLAHLQR